jgi:uroporphyrinogen-III synthase
MQGVIMPTNSTLSPSESLQGCRVALTIAPDDPASPASELGAREAVILHYPVAQWVPPDSYDALDEALTRGRAGAAKWLLLTTPFTVEAVAQRMAELGSSTAGIREARLALFGAKTVLTAAKLMPDWHAAVTHSGTHAEMIAAMQLTTGDTVLLPIAQRSRSDWKDQLAATGAEVDAPSAYRLLLGRGGDDLPGLLWGGLVDAVIFLTENSARHFSIRLKAEGGTLDMLRDVIIACLDGPSAATARAYGLTVHVISPSGDYDALARSLAHRFHAEPVRT